MDQNLKNKCDLIIENRNILKKKMMWEAESNLSAIMSAMILAAAGVKADADKYVECKKLLIKKVGAFNEFRGIARPMVITKMTLADNPEEYIEGAMAVYKKLRAAHKFTASPYMVMAALTLYENGGVENADDNIVKLDSLYYTLQKQHPFLIMDEDRGYLSMLVAFGRNLDAMPDEIEKCYQACKKFSYSKDAVHSLAQVLALSSKDVETKSKNVDQMIDMLRRSGRKISKSRALSAIGALELIEMTPEQKVTQIAQLDDYLRDKKGFKSISIGSKMRRMIAAMIVLMTNASNEDATILTNLSSTLVVTIIEEIITMLIIAMASSSAAASSSSH